MLVTLLLLEVWCNDAIFASATAATVAFLFFQQVRTLIDTYNGVFQLQLWLLGGNSSPFSHDVACAVLWAALSPNFYRLLPCVQRHAQREILAPVHLR